MNILDIVILAILGISLISGMRKGFIGSILAVVGFGAALFGAFRFSPMLSSAIQSNEQIMGTLSYYIDTGAMMASEWANRMVASLSQTQIGQIIANIQLPEAVKNVLSTNLSQQTFIAEGLDTVSQYVSQTVSGTIVNIVSFAVMFAVSYWVILAVVRLLDKVFEFPILRHFDALIGGAFGLIRGAVISMLIVSILPFVTSFLSAELLDELIAGSTMYGIFCRGGILEQLARSVL
jgi:uncharacterized membrane protein required for colicin V production